MIATSAYRFAQLLRNQWLMPQRLEAIQRVKLQALLSHAYRHVPYYRDLFDRSGVKPEDIHEPRQLTRLPVTTKAELLRHDPEARVARGAIGSHALTLRTSGSQGMPFEVRMRPEDKRWWGMLAMRGWLASHYRFRYRTLIISDSRFTPHARRWFEALGVFRKTYVSNHDSVESQLETLDAYRPEVLRGITSDVYLLARALRERGADTLAPKLIVTSAELMDPATRRFIDDTFGVALVDFYGSIECGWVGWECPAHAGYHLNSDCLIVEFLNDGEPVSPGEPGEVVVTNLHGYAMPFIRYSVGDIGVPDATRCPCGRGLPLMHTVVGRTIDHVVLPDGRRISPYQLTCTLERIPGIGRYQVVQLRDDRLLVKLIPNPSYGEQTERQIQADLADLLGGGVAIETQIVDELEKDSSGKFRVVMRGTSE